MDEDFSWIGVFRVGDRVQIKASVERPRFGWGGVSHDCHGTLCSFDDSGRCTVDFGSRASSWSGVLLELEKIDVSCSGGS